MGSLNKHPLMLNNGPTEDVPCVYAGIFRNLEGHVSYLDPGYISDGRTNQLGVSEEKPQELYGFRTE